MISSNNNLNNSAAAEYTEYCDLSLGQKLKGHDLRHYFQKQSIAHGFAKWINDQSPAHNVMVQSKYSYLNVSTLYYVSISETQFNRFVGANAFANLLSEKEIDEAHAIIFKNIADIHTWESILRQNTFLHEFNQRRLMDRSRHNNSKNLLLKLFLENHSALLPSIIKLFSRSESETQNGAISANFGKIILSFLTH